MPEMKGLQLKENQSKTKNRFSISAEQICVVAVFMALNVVMSSFGVPVPGGHLYLNDVIICSASILLDPLSAFLVGGVGAFLYSTPEYALIKLPYQILQAAVGACAGMILCWKCKLTEVYERRIVKRKK